MKNRVYIPELDMIYDSIAEASEVLNVNSSNISKVLHGSRKTAGGYHFISADNDRGGRRSFASLRKEARALFPDPLAEERAELRRAIQAVNKQAKRMQGSGWGVFAGAIQDLLALGDVFGRTKAGYLKASDSMLYQLNEAEIKKYMEAIEERKKRRSYTLGGAMAEAERLAGTFWTTSSRVAELGDALPFIFAMMHNEIPDMGGSEVIRRKAAEIFNNPDAKLSTMIDAISDLTEFVDTSNALEDMLKTDFFLLDKFAAIRPQLEQLMQIRNDPDFAGSDVIEDTVESVSQMIIQHWQDPDVGDLLDILKDDIEGTLNYYGVPIGGYDEDEDY